MILPKVSRLTSLSAVALLRNWHKADTFSTFSLQIQTYRKKTRDSTSSSISKRWDIRGLFRKIFLMRFIVSTDATTGCKFYDTIAILSLLIDSIDSNVSPFQNEREQDNFIRKLRYFSDEFYPWGKQKRDTQNDMDDK